MLSGVAARLLTPSALFALALLVRCLPWPTVMEHGRVVFFGMDAWYHMRRAQIALAGSGWPPAFDSYLNFPHGGMPIWPPLFDAMLAWWMGPARGVGGWGAAEQAAALLPPVLGAACVVVVYAFGVRLFDRSVAVVAALGLCFLSAHVWYSQIGFVDHHAAVALLTLLLLAAASGMLDRILGSRTGLLRWAAWTGAAAGVCLLVWPGTVLHVAIVVGALAVAWLSRADPQASRAGARGVMVAGAVALALVTPFGWWAGWPDARAFSPTVLSRFQPWLFACLTASAAICAAAIRFGVFGRSPAARAGFAVAVGCVVLATGWLVAPGVGDGLVESWRWLARDEAFQGLVRESRPLFVSNDGPGVRSAELRLSRLLYLLPFALAALGLSARRSARPGSVALLVAWTLVLAVATMAQRRFFNSLSPAYALVMAWACVSAVRALPGRLAGGAPRPPGRVRVAQACVAGVALLLYAATLEAQRPPVRNLLAWVRGQPLSMPEAEISRRAAIGTARWLRDHTPPTAGLLDPHGRPGYGVLSAWGYGHLIKYVAQRPTVVGNFGDDVGGQNLQLSNAYFARPEPEAVAIAERLRARYVLSQSLGDAAWEHLEGDTMRQRLSLDDSPGLQHHRLLYESPLDARWARIGRSEFRIFERVAGARLEGEAQPGARVTAALRYRSNRGRSGRFTTTAQADARGRYSLVLPYATRGSPPGIEVEGPYRVLSGDESHPVTVRERDVQDGAVVRGPDFS
jgi:dolichyl-diphosphooligosaccharide--protein glycosyltransferase